MKTFIYTVTSEVKRSMGGCYVKGIIYRIKNNFPCQIATYNYNTASCKGADSEILTTIAGNTKELTKKEKASFKGLYYSWMDSEYAGVKIISV
jgi:hypothetical protein